MRHKEGKRCANTVFAVMNMSGEEQTVTVDLVGYECTYKCLGGHKHEMQAAQTFTLRPWGFKIFEK